MLCAGMIPRDAAGRMRCTVAAPAAGNGGTPIAATGQLAISATVPAVYVHGVGFDGGALCVDVGGTVDHYGQGYGFSTTDRVVCDAVGAIDHYLFGLPYTAGGAFAVVVE